MTQNTKKQVRLIYHVLISIALAVAAVLLMIQCVAIYLDDASFTRETVIAHFAPIAVPVYLCIALVVAGFALSPLLPPAADSAPDRDAVTLRRLQDKTDLSLCPPALVDAVNKHRRARRCHSIITMVLLAIGIATFLWYVMDKSHFTDDWNATMVNAMKWLFPCMGVPAAYGVFTAYFFRRSMKEEIAQLRTAPKNSVRATDKVPAKSEKWMPFVQGGIFAVGVGLVVYGALYNGALDMLWKAINICKECIGIG